MPEPISGRRRKNLCSCSFWPSIPCLQKLSTLKKLLTQMDVSPHSIQANVQDQQQLIAYSMRCLPSNVDATNGYLVI